MKKAISWAKVSFSQKERAMSVTKDNTRSAAPLMTRIGKAKGKVSSLRQKSCNYCDESLSAAHINLLTEKTLLWQPNLWGACQANMPLWSLCCAHFPFGCCWHDFAYTLLPSAQVYINTARNLAWCSEGGALGRKIYFVSRRLCLVDQALILNYSNCEGNEDFSCDLITHRCCATLHNTIEFLLLYINVPHSILHDI